MTWLSHRRKRSGERITVPSPPAAPNFSLINFLPAPDLQNEEVYALEAGCSAQCAALPADRGGVYHLHHACCRIDPD